MVSTSTAPLIFSLVALGIFGCQLSTSDSRNDTKGFPTPEAEMEAPVWVQLLIGSLLLTIFAAAVSDGEQEQRSKGNLKSARVMPQPKTLALRFAVLLGLFGVRNAIHAARSSSMVMANFPSKHTVVETPEWAQLLFISMLMCIFAAAVWSDAEQDPENEPSATVVPRVGSLALRHAVVVGLLGLQGAIGALSQYMPASARTTLIPATAFPSSSMTLQVPVWTQLLLVSVLLLVFAVAIRTDNGEVREQSFSRTTSWSVGVSLGLLLVIHHVLPVRSTILVFPSADVTLDVPVWAQLGLVVASLSLLWTLAQDGYACNLDEQPLDHEAWAGVAKKFTEALQKEMDEMDEMDEVDVVDDIDKKSGHSDHSQNAVPQASNVSLRLSVALGLLSAVNATFPVTFSLVLFRSTAFFPSKDASVEAPMWIQFGVVSLMLFMFAAFVREAEQECSGSHAKVGRPPMACVVALRLSAASILLGACYAASGSMANPQQCVAQHHQGFPLSDIFTETPMYMQLALFSVLIFVFALAVQGEQSFQGSTVSQSKAVSFGTLALACASAAFEVVKPVVPDIDGDLVVQGGLLLVGTAAVLSDDRVRRFVLRDEKLF